MLTVKFFEDLLETFKKIPDFQFVLDSQAVPLEDYLEMFPEKKNLLKKLAMNHLLMDKNVRCEM
jgi:alpha-mannosidase